MSWTFSDNAKRVRKLVYERFLTTGAGVGNGTLLEESGLSPEALRDTIKELERGLMVMCPDGTHDVAKCPPWSNIPTRHDVELDGKHICYAGCMLEAMNMAYCYPGKAITIRSSCPETGTEIRLTMRGNEILASSPAGLVGHIGVDPALWSENWFHGCDNNNFFASSDAVAAWEARHPERRGITLSLDQLKSFARYENRLDFERGADPDVNRTGAKMFGPLGVKVPEHWSDVQVQGGSRE